MSYEPQFGYNPNPVATAYFVRQPGVGLFGTRAAHLIGAAEKKDTFLWLPLLKLRPNWKRGAQAIGSCVAWGAELATTMLMAVQDALGQSSFVEEAATEPIYGGRAELGQGSWSDGWYGSGAAQWLREYGVILRLDYSKETGNPETDLRVYSGTKEKNWGYYGNGGKPDDQAGGKFDAVAKQHPIRNTSLVRNCNELEAAILNGYPVTVASGVGYGSMNRDADGVVRRSGSWSHQMMFGGIRYHATRGRLFRQFQSWGPNSCSGPDPGIEHAAVSGCSWWTTEADAQVQLNGDDSFAIGHADGWPAQTLPNWGSSEYL